jgi:hypothetical protein
MSMAPTGDKVLLRLTLNNDAAPAFQFSRGAKGLVVSFKSNLAQRNTPQLAVQTAPKGPTPVAPRAAAPQAPAPAGPIARLKNFIGSLWSGAEAPPAEQAQPAAPRHHVAKRPPMATPTHPAHGAAKPAPVAVKPAPVAAKPEAKPEAKPPIAKTQAVKPAAPAHVASKPEASLATATFGAPRYDAERGMLVVPFRGHLTRQSLAPIQLNSRWAYLDVAQARPAFTGVRFGQPHTAGLDRWAAARRPHRDATRLSFALAAPSDIAVKAVPGALLVAVTPKTMLLGRANAHGAARVAAKPAPIQLAGRSLVARPFFDETRYGLVVPYVGETPLYRWEKTGDKEVVIALKGRLNAVGDMVQRFSGHRVMSSWKLTPGDRPGIVNLALSFNRSAEVVVAADPTRRQLVLIPQPRLADGDAPAAAGGVHAVLANVERDAENRVIYIPFEGEVPSYTVEQVSANFATVDFENAERDEHRVSFYAPEYHPSLNYWLLSDRPGAGRVRLSLSMTQPAQPRVFEDRANHRLVVTLDERNGLTPGRSATMTPGLWDRVRPEADRPNSSPTADIGRRAS